MRHEEISTANLAGSLVDRCGRDCLHHFQSENHRKVYPRDRHPVGALALWFGILVGWPVRGRSLLLRPQGCFALARRADRYVPGAPFFLRVLALTAAARNRLIPRSVSQDGTAS